MRFATSLLGLTAWSLLALSSVAEEANSELVGCAAEPSEDFLALADEIRQQEIDNAFDESEAQQAFRIEVYFHVLTTTQQEMNSISDQAISAQVSVLNQVYSRYGILFEWGGLTRDVAPSYASADMYPVYTVTRARHQGGYSALNVYMMSNLGTFGPYTTLGYAQFPKDAAPGSQDFYSDGVAIRSDTIPGGSFLGYNSGKNLVHEVGHWLGLLHTFQGGCDGGDGVDDTPFQARASDGQCNQAQDTCPNLPGTDPIHNFMDYSSEVCKWEFTPGQALRMQLIWDRFRAGRQAAVTESEDLPPLDSR